MLVLSGRAVVPQRLHIEWDGSTLLTMPAIADGSLARFGPRT
jgi:hypothetical protein